MGERVYQLEYQRAFENIRSEYEREYEMRVTENTVIIMTIKS